MVTVTAGKSTGEIVRLVNFRELNGDNHPSFPFIHFDRRLINAILSPFILNWQEKSL